MMHGKTILFAKEEWLLCENNGKTCGDVLLEIFKGEDKNVWFQ